MKGTEEKNSCNVYNEDADCRRGTHKKLLGAVKVRAAIGLKYNRA
jgi:hypothetical protein